MTVMRFSSHPCAGASRGAAPAEPDPYPAAVSRPPKPDTRTSVGSRTVTTEGVAAEQRTTPVELFWDLVFVFAITQVSALLAHHLTWEGFGQSMLVLALVWWAWSAFVWVTNAHDPDDPLVRGALFLAMILAFLVALAVPEAWGERGARCSRSPTRACASCTSRCTPTPRAAATRRSPRSPASRSRS